MQGLSLIHIWLINLFNPDLIVLGGTLAVAKDYIMLPLKSAINKYSLQLVNLSLIHILYPRKTNGIYMKRIWKRKLKRINI